MLLIGMTVACHAEDALHDAALGEDASSDGVADAHVVRDARAPQLDASLLPEPGDDRTDLDDASIDASPATVEGALDAGASQLDAGTVATDAAPDAGTSPDAGGCSLAALRETSERCAEDARAWVADDDGGLVGGGACDGDDDAGAPCPCTLPGTLTLSWLLAEMVDLGQLSRAPEAPYASRFVSSHDRRSDQAAPGDPDWFANADYITLGPGETHTLLDATGPGVITRVWSASPAGTLRVFIDGAEEPTVEADFPDWLGGAVAPFEAPFAFDAAGGQNLYFPIPFADAIRITLTGPIARTYYHISYRAYDATTPVESFGPEAVAASRATLQQVNACLSELTPQATLQRSEPSAFTLDSGDTSSRAVIERPNGGVITSLRIRPLTDDASLMRSTVLSIAFDGTETVRVPLATFFAVGHERQGVNALPIGVDASGTLTSRWAMPFQRAASVQLASTDGRQLRAELEATSVDRAWGEDSLYFHAFWQAARTFASKPSHDWNMVTLVGRGLFVGNVLNVANRNEAWWGEGDEKIYVDGEAFPSHFGTGTEDYYGYAYCSNERFTLPYVGQPLAGAKRNYGHMTLYRFHVLDPIPFDTSLRFDLEVRHWGDPVNVTYDATSFWYGPASSTATGTPAGPDDFVPVALDVPAPAFRDGPYRCGP